MSHAYLDAVRQGKNEWWRYLISILLIFGAALFVGSFVMAIVAVVWLTIQDPMLVKQSGGLEAAINALITKPSIASYVLNNIPFIFFFGAILLAVRLVHQRPMLSLLSGDNTLNGRRFLTGFGVWFLLQAVLLGLAYWQAPSEVVWTFVWWKWVPLLLLVTLMTPIQIAAEELLCRAYLMQGLSLVTRNRWLLMGLPSLLFAVAHFGNPEMARDKVWMALQYWSLGVFLAALTLRDNRLELALGIHAAQNFFVLLFANTADSVLPTPSMFTLSEPDNPKLGLLVFLIQAAIFSWILFGRRSRLKME
jgi:uncharacterized protein